MNYVNHVETLGLFDM